MALDFEDLKDRVAQRAPNPCAACGGIDFDLQPDLVLLPWAQPEGADFRPLERIPPRRAWSARDADSSASMRS